MEASSGLRVFQSLADVYEEADVPSQTARWHTIKANFEAKFGHAPTFFARSPGKIRRRIECVNYPDWTPFDPGRVNIIGEHIDYSGYSVLPLALSTQDVVMAVRVNTSSPPTVTVHNSSPEKFPTRSFPLLSQEQGYVQLSATSGHSSDWMNYLKGGFKSMLDFLKPTALVGFDIFVDGSVPAGAGVSSSAAFSCSLCEAIAFGLGQTTISSEDLVPQAIRAEHLAGVSCGGMDQSISLLGRRGCCLTINFVPKLSAEVVTVPQGVKFAVVNTGVVADKAETAPANYNRRVVETRAAAALLYKHHGIPLPTLPKQPTIRSFQDLYLEQQSQPAFTPKTARSVLQQMVVLVDYLLGPKSAFDDRASRGWTRAEIASELGNDWWSRFVGDMRIAGDQFMLYNRLRHVLTEAERVYAFREVCEKGGANAVNELGRLMNESQDSCRDLFECSCPEIDEVCNIGRSLGSLGSRLTGAGWGGCTVHLVPDNEVERFTEGVFQQYLAKKFPAKPHTLVREYERYLANTREKSTNHSRLLGIGIEVIESVDQSDSEVLGDHEPRSDEADFVRNLTEIVRFRSRVYGLPGDKEIDWLLAVRPLDQPNLAYQLVLYLITAPIDYLSPVPDFPASAVPHVPVPSPPSREHLSPYLREDQGNTRGGVAAGIDDPEKITIWAKFHPDGGFSSGMFEDGVVLVWRFFGDGEEPVQSSASTLSTLGFGERYQSGSPSDWMYVAPITTLLYEGQPRAWIRGMLGTLAAWLPRSIIGAVSTISAFGQVEGDGGIEGTVAASHGNNSLLMNRFLRGASASVSSWTARTLVGASQVLANGVIKTVEFVAWGIGLNTRSEPREQSTTARSDLPHATARPGELNGQGEVEVVPPTPETAVHNSPSQGDANAKPAPRRQNPKRRVFKRKRFIQIEQYPPLAVRRKRDGGW
ncbi:Galactokinase [Gonapodya prolifera JEL478]|uniref:Galactokinase n=1 Tax=Gonapodya prolifera (strain JEL478) TaxID=1344416 RepID=A0A138ZXE0_GONPJ|nr:Galactokinase [Gonapodya prolifera JEL478]|eukprot:KXS09149.1 Galactokinase [Gonapodya prolifera JEL478]